MISVQASRIFVRFCIKRQVAAKVVTLVNNYAADARTGIRSAAAGYPWLRQRHRLRWRAHGVRCRRHIAHSGDIGHSPSCRASKAARRPANNSRRLHAGNPRRRPRASRSMTARGIHAPTLLGSAARCKRRRAGNSYLRYDLYLSMYGLIVSARHPPGHMGETSAASRLQS